MLQRYSRVENATFRYQNKQLNCIRLKHFQSENERASKHQYPWWIYSLRQSLVIKNDIKTKKVVWIQLLNWSNLEFCLFPENSKEDPALFKYIKSIVCESTSKLQIHLVSMMHTCKDSSGPLARQQLPENILGKIPKEWNYITHDHKCNDTNKSM